MKDSILLVDTLLPIFRKPIHSEVYDVSLWHELAVRDTDLAPPSYLSRVRTLEVRTDAIEIRSIHINIFKGGPGS